MFILSYRRLGSGFVWLLLWLLAGASLPGRAQQLAQYSQYMNNNYVLNPAVAGTEDYIDVKLSDRTQWVGLEGAPRTYYLTANSALGAAGTKGKRPRQNRPTGFHAIGGIVYNDVTGPTSRLGVYGSYAYNLPLTPSLRLALGVSVGMQQFAVDGSQLQFHSGYQAGSEASRVPDATVGLWLYSPRFYAGISSAQLLGNRLALAYSQTAQTVYYNRLERHYFATAGVRLPLNDDLTLVPSALVRLMGSAPSSVDLNAKLKYHEIVWIGGSWRMKDSVVGMVGVGLGELGSISYSYDATSSELSGYQGGSHEVLLSLRFHKKAKVLCPSRFW